MCYQCAHGRGPHNPTYESSPNYQHNQQYTSGYESAHGYQIIRPPPIYTGYPSIGHSMDRTSSHGFDDSGYATRTPSVANPILQQSYPIQSYSTQSYPGQSYSCQNYSVQSYVPSRQLSQQSANYSYSNQRSPNIEVVHAAPVSSSKHTKKRRLSTPSPSPPSEYPCLYPNCGHISSRARELKQHIKLHFPPAVDELLDCKYEWCGRTGAHGFKREDHRKEHYRKVHMKGNEYPKPGSVGKSGRSGRSVALENRNTPVRIQTTDRKHTAKNKNAPSSGNPQASGLSTEAVAQFGNLQPAKKKENPPDQGSAGLKVSVSDSAVVMSEALDADNVELLEWTFSEPEYEENELSSSSDDESHSTKDKLAVIKSQVLKTLLASEASQYCASLKIQWDILGFMEDQFRDNDFPNTALGPIVTISGSAQQAQATTCSEYIRQNWPTYGSHILDALQDALDTPTHMSHLEIGAHIDDGNVSNDGTPSSHAELEFDVTQERFLLNIKSGTPNIIVEVTQQLTWMGAALRTSSDGRVQYCESRLERFIKAKGVEPAMFKVTFDMTSPGEKDQSCWFPLFTNPVIAYGFPTAHRSDHEVGLEIPLDMMAALGGARHAVDFEGGLVLKGYSALFVPVRRHEESVQWHMIRARGEDRIPYREASRQCPNRALLKDLSHEALGTTRAYLGWWKDAGIHLGTADADYESIDWSKAKVTGSSLRLTGGTFGVSKIVAVQASFALGAKDGPFHYSQAEPFQKTIDRAENIPVVLYDQEDRRAWLVPALPVILHIIQLRNHTKPFVVDGKKVQISPLDLSRQGLAAREAVTKNKSQRLFDCESNEDKEYCFRDAILDTWSTLDLLMEREATTKATPGMAMHATWQNVLYGWEFRAVADEDRLLKKKEQVLEKTAGRWCDLVEDVDAVVLFASGLGDVIKPRSDLGRLCQEWRTLPKDKDYLAVCVPMLETFYAKAGHRQDHQYLTSAKLQWHIGSTLFEHCTGVTSNYCECNRVQQVYRDSYKTIGHGTPPSSLEATGCVAFGQAHHPIKQTRTVAIRENAVHILPNTSIQNAGVAEKVSTRDNGIRSPSPPASFSPEPEEVNSYAIRSPKRPPSPLSSTDDLVQETANASKRRRRTSHIQISKSDAYKPDAYKPDAYKPDEPNEQISVLDDCAVCPPEYQSMLNRNIHSKGQHVVSTQITRASEAVYAPVHSRTAKI